MRFPASWSRHCSPWPSPVRLRGRRGLQRRAAVDPAGLGKVNYETPAATRARRPSRRWRSAPRSSRSRTRSRRGADLGSHRREQLRRREGRLGRSACARKRAATSRRHSRSTRRRSTLGLHQSRHAVLQGARLPDGFSAITTRRQLLKKALELNPNGIDPNYFYGELLFEEGKYNEALKYLDKAPRRRRARAANSPTRGGTAKLRRSRPRSGRRWAEAARRGLPLRSKARPDAVFRATFARQQLCVTCRRARSSGAG